jgi:membrane-bound lytic murein transglycosylase B
VNTSVRHLGCILAFVLPTLSAWQPAQASTHSYNHNPEVTAFIRQMVKKHDFKTSYLRKVFAQAHYRQSIIDAMTRPAEAKPWYEYRPIFLTHARIRAGAKFWSHHRKALVSAEKQYGVPPRIIVAIIGVETFYGRVTGHFSALDALSTLSFDYPPRASYFQSELEQFLLMTREESLDPTKVSGSYAGAMGGGQFMPSSFRRYAIDFDGDGHRDLWKDWTDVVGSVAHYLSAHGWQRNALITVPAALREKATLASAAENANTVGALRKAGLEISSGLSDSEEAKLITLEQRDGNDYWVALHNFQVIMTYNRSPLYAMAVTQLGDAIARQRPDAHDQ